MCGGQSRPPFTLHSYTRLLVQNLEKRPGLSGGAEGAVGDVFERGQGDEPLRLPPFLGAWEVSPDGRHAAYPYPLVDRPRGADGYTVRSQPAGCLGDGEQLLVTHRRSLRAQAALNDAWKAARLSTRPPAFMIPLGT